MKLLLNLAANDHKPITTGAAESKKKASNAEVTDKNSLDLFSDLPPPEGRKRKLEEEGNEDNSKKKTVLGITKY